jgi:hypothetical protein
MNLNKVQKTLENLFTEKQKRIIFWYDGEKEFEDLLPDIQLDPVRILRLDQVSPLELKISIATRRPRHPIPFVRPLS